jgi:hypothetical protein
VDGGLWKDILSAAGEWRAVTMRGVTFEDADLSGLEAGRCAHTGCTVTRSSLPADLVERSGRRRTV